jgi:ABC-type enterochelin transport system permease subunit
VASILDLAVIALAVMVCGTLGLLAWTLGIAVPNAVRHAQADVLRARLRMVVAERRMRAVVQPNRRPDSEGDR